MEIKKLQQRQLFCTKRETVEQKVVQYFEKTQDADSVVEYAIALMVRHALVLGDFSLLFQDVIREIYSHARPSNTLKKFLPYFQSYFSDSEWQQIIKRLFISEKKYKKATKNTRIQASYLKNTGSAAITKEFGSYTLVTIYKDASGKKHTWRLRDADPRNTVEETERILEILTNLTIFQKDGVRRFAEYIDYDCAGTTIVSSSRGTKEETQETLGQSNVAVSIKVNDSTGDEANLIDGYDLNTLSKETLIELLMSIYKEANAATMEEKMLEDCSEIAPPLGVQTSLDDRTVSSNEKTSAELSSTDGTEEKIPAMALAGAGIETSAENYMLEKNADNGKIKKPKKKDRKLLKNFQNSRKQNKTKRHYLE
jgi:hypothetical protein